MVGDARECDRGHIGDDFFYGSELAAARTQSAPFEPSGGAGFSPKAARRCSVENANLAFSQLDHPRTLPCMKLLVDAFPGCPKQAGKFVLGDADAQWLPLSRAGRVCQAGQPPCQPDIEPLGERSLDMLVGLPEATAKQFEKRDAEIRPAL